MGLQFNPFTSTFDFVGDTDGFALDDEVVHNTGDESVAGVKTFTSDPIVPDEAYGVGWNGSAEVPTKNALYDKIETLGFTHPDPHLLGDGTVSAPAYSFSGDTNTGIYRIGADSVGMTAGGVQQAWWGGTGALGVATGFNVTAEYTGSITATRYAMIINPRWTGGVNANAITLAALAISNSAGEIVWTDDQTSGTFYGLQVAPHITVGDGSGTAGPTLTNLYGLYFKPTTLDGSDVFNSVITNMYGIYVEPNAGSATTNAYGVRAKINANLGIITTGYGIYIESAVGFASLGTMIGLGITGLSGGTTKWGMQVGDYQSYHHGKFSLGGTTAPTYGLDMLGTAQDRGVIRLAESTATPTNPSSSTGVLLYHKADKLVAAFNNAGTMLYWTLDLTAAANQSWVRNTTAP